MTVDMKLVSDQVKENCINSSPCFEEAKLSKKCMEENYYDSSKCLYHFENYKGCLQFWHIVKRLRMNNRIRPFMPDKEERQKIINERRKGINVYQVI